MNQELKRGSGPSQIVKKATEAGFEVRHQVFDSGAIVVIGRRGERRFQARWNPSGESLKIVNDYAYWWTRHRRAFIPGVPGPTNETQRAARQKNPLPQDEWVEWTTDRPEPVKISVTELKTRLDQI